MSFTAPWFAKTLEPNRSIDVIKMHPSVYHSVLTPFRFLLFFGYFVSIQGRCVPPASRQSKIKSVRRGSVSLIDRERH